MSDTAQPATPKQTQPRSAGRRLPKRSDALLRRFAPAVPALSRKRWLMAPIDAVDWFVCKALGIAGETPPNRMRIRVGAGNRLVFNQIQHRELPVGYWLERFSEGSVRLDSRILDIGSGCGRFASVLAGTRFSNGPRFMGSYTGVDVDPEMVAWCRKRFPAERFTFLLSEMASRVYNPGGERRAGPRLDVEDASQDFVFSVSLFTHLLEGDVVGYLRETARVLAPGGSMRMTVFCMDHLRDKGVLGGRWTFEHRDGAAYIENPAYPEAAVAFERAWLVAACEGAGLAGVRVVPRAGQSVLVAGKPH